MKCQNHQFRKFISSLKFPGLQWPYSIKAICQEKMNSAVAVQCWSVWTENKTKKKLQMYLISHSSRGRQRPQSLPLSDKKRRSHETSGTINPESYFYFCMHFIFAHFVHTSFHTKIKRIRKVQSESENPQRSAAVQKCHAYKRSEVPAYENLVLQNILDL